MNLLTHTTTSMNGKNVVVRNFSNKTKIARGFFYYYFLKLVMPMDRLLKSNMDDDDGDHHPCEARIIFDGFLHCPPK